MSTSSTERDFRAFFIVLIPCLLVINMGAVATVLCFTADMFVASPLLFTGMGLMRQLRWVMFWQSTPEERRILARNLQREPYADLIKAWLKIGQTPIVVSKRNVERG